MPVLGLRFDPGANKHFFLKSQFYRRTDLHATYKLAITYYPFIGT